MNCPIPLPPSPVIGTTPGSQPRRALPWRMEYRLTAPHFPASLSTNFGDFCVSTLKQTCSFCRPNTNQLRCFVGGPAMFDCDALHSPKAIFIGAKTRQPKTGKLRRELTLSSVLPTSSLHQTYWNRTHRQMHCLRNFKPSSKRTTCNETRWILSRLLFSVYVFRTAESDTIPARTR